VGPPETYKLPAVVSQLEDNAKKLMAGKCKTMDPCVEVEVQRINDNKIANGLVVRTEPQAGSEVQVGSKVTIFVSKGPDKVTIISVAGLAADDARDKLQKSCGAEDCLDVETNVIANNTVPSGKVISTDPAAGIVVPVGSKVKMFVSGGADEVMIPSVRNRLATDARNLLQATCKQSTCLKVVQTNESSDQIAAGRAIRTNPLIGMVKIGSSVVLIISTGPEVLTVGDYRGSTEAEARLKILHDRFTVGTVKRIPMLLRPPSVISQDPAAGSKAPKGSKISFVVLGGGSP
jgi:serine/threonine-protein kinase